jgi:SM-20-related protein
VLAGVDAEIEAGGLAVRDDFLTRPHIAELAGCARHRLERGDFHAARIGAGGGQRRADIRGDSTCWIVPPYLPAEERLLQSLEQLRLELNRGAYLGLLDLELHYAHYPPGAGYARHVDQPHGREHRLLSVLLYLNEGWSREAGGELRMFDETGYRDIEPIAGRLVCFLTAGREHAVLPTRRERLSISGWFRARD